MVGQTDKCSTENGVHEALLFSGRRAAWGDKHGEPCPSALRGRLRPHPSRTDRVTAAAPNPTTAALLTNPSLRICSTPRRVSSPYYDLAVKVVSRTSALGCHSNGFFKPIVNSVVFE